MITLILGGFSWLFSYHHTSPNEIYRLRPTHWWKETLVYLDLWHPKKLLRLCFGSLKKAKETQPRVNRQETRTQNRDNNMEDTCEGQTQPVCEKKSERRRKTRSRLSTTIWNEITKLKSYRFTQEIITPVTSTSRSGNNNNNNMMKRRKRRKILMLRPNRA